MTINYQLSKRIRIELASLNNCFVQYRFQTKTYHLADKNKIKQMLYEAIDAISESLERRFLHSNSDVLKQNLLQYFSS